jgi:four helix bundle protein
VISPQSTVHRSDHVEDRKETNEQANMAFKFEELKAREELYVLTSQIKRAADSVALNVAEGSTGQTNPEFRQFVGYAIRSAIEVVACLHLAKRRHLISEEKFMPLYDETEEIVRMLQGLRKSLK